MTIFEYQIWSHFHQYDILLSMIYDHLGSTPRFSVSYTALCIKVGYYIFYVSVKLIFLLWQDYDADK